MFRKKIPKLDWWRSRDPEKWKIKSKKENVYVTGLGSHCTLYHMENRFVYAVNKGSDVFVRPKYSVKRWRQLIGEEKTDFIHEIERFKD
ncbi:hypothetical protein IIC68_01885 [archaeon]|nr:hypothetical protein [archaeon]